MSKVESYQRYVWPQLERVDPEMAHQMAINMLEVVSSQPWLLKALERVVYEPGVKREKLALTFGEMEFDNPVVLAAGFDKDGRVIKSVEAMGFGGIEVGSVLVRPQRGNQSPTIFRLGEESLLNRMGFPSRGVSEVKKNLENTGKTGMRLGVNVGVNRDISHGQMWAEYSYVVDHLSDFADFFVLNFSSPNTKGLRSVLSNELLLSDIVGEVKGVLRRRGLSTPLYIKLSPDESKSTMEGIIRVVLDEGLNGVVATNTSSSNVIKRGFGEEYVNEQGGVSGKAINELVNETIKFVQSESGGRIEIAASGGIRDVKTALEKVRAGAKILEVYTGYIYKGPSFANWLKAGLVSYMEEEGINNLEEIRGKDE